MAADQMEHLGIDPDFFDNERTRLYTEWELKFWREMFQNSIDAGAKAIVAHVTEEKDEEGNTFPRVIFRDNGKGMNEDELRNVFFKIGATSKRSDDDIGGFGRARILTCFSHRRYRIMTGDCLVEGRGSFFRVSKLAKPVQGCRFEIDVKGADFATMQRERRRYLSYCQMDATVMLFNEESKQMEPWTNWAHRRTKTRELIVNGDTFASVHLSKSSDTHRGSLIVRVNGVAMYDLPHSAQGRVIIELDPKQSRKVLTISRDSMHYRYNAAVNNFLSEIAIDKKSALREQKNRRNFVIKGNNGGGTFTAAVNPEKEKPTKAKNDKEAEATRRIQYEAEAYKEPEIKAGQAAPDRDIVAVGSKHMGTSWAGTEEVPENQRLGEEESPDAAARRRKDVADSFVPFDVFINQDNPNPAIRRAMAKFDTRRWSQLGDGFGGGNAAKLLVCWQVAVEHAVRTLLKTGGGGNLRFAIGWYFGQEALAVHHRTEEGVHVYFLMPVDKDGRMAYRTSSREDRKTLMALAKHEVTHTIVGWHNEEFSTLHTMIDAKFDEKDCHRDMELALEALRERTALLSSVMEKPDGAVPAIEDDGPRLALAS